jgi:hypothetical protein
VLADVELGGEFAATGTLGEEAGNSVRRNL